MNAQDCTLRTLPACRFRSDGVFADNHTQFQSVDGTARFDPAGQQVNGQFGQVTITRAPRVVQLSLQFQF